ncbi:MAG: IS5 family transposase [Xanthobacteraceae bacterium]
MRRYALRDDQWDRIKDILPGREGHVGATAKDNRLFVEAVLYRYRAGIPWRDLPERFGDPIKVHTRFSRWAKPRRMEEALRNAGRRRGQRIRHDRQHYRACAPAQCRCSKKDGDDQAIGRSKGGLSTKIHAMVDALGNPLAFFLTAGQAHDLQGADALLPQMQADTLLADKAFDADERVIEPLLAAGKMPVIPPKSNRKSPRPYDKEIYKARHLMENFYCKLKQYRAIATRYDKTARNFLASIHLAAAVIWLN